MMSAPQSLTTPIRHQMSRTAVRGAGAIAARNFHASGVAQKKGDLGAAELTKILTEKMAGYDSETNIDEVGKVLSIGDGIARVYGLRSVQAGEMVEFPGGEWGRAMGRPAAAGGGDGAAAAVVWCSRCCSCRCLFLLLLPPPLLTLTAQASAEWR